MDGLMFLVLIMGGWILLGLVLERLLPAERAQPRRHLLFNIAYLPIYLASLAYLAPMLAAWMPFREFAMFKVDWGNSLYGAFAQALVAMIVADFFYYWWHRAQHTWDPLWKLHELHHADRSLNVTSATRHHWLEETLRPLVVGLPVGLLFQLGPTQFFIVGLLLSSYPFFIHSNLRLELGRLSRVVVGPQYHRIHHSIEERHWNKNFAAFFPFWDELFGSQHLPQRGEFPPTGIEGVDGEFAVSCKLALSLPVVRLQRKQPPSQLS